MIAALPYAGTSGWSGSETSRARAEHEDSTGLTVSRQQLTLRHLRHAGLAGLTFRELGDITGWHHGQSSGVLSVLHKEGMIARLAASRDGSKIYVRMDCIAGRPTEQHGGKAKTCPHCGESID